MSKADVMVTIFCAIFSSLGFWTFVNNVYQNHREKKSAERKALLGLLHETIVERSAEYMARQGITQQEYNDLHTYIYDPYKELGGNGTGEKLMEEVEKLPIVMSR